MILKQVPDEGRAVIFLPYSTKIGDKHTLRKGQMKYPCHVAEIPVHRRFAVLDCGYFLECWPIEPRWNPIVSEDVEEKTKYRPGEIFDWQKDLKRVRISLGLSQRQASQLLGVPEATYSVQERGKGPIPYELVEKYKKTFHLEA